MGKFREHGVMLFLDSELYLGFIKLQADKSLGRSFAGLLPFVEGIYSMGYINKECYEKHKAKYSVKLGVEPSVPVENKYANMIKEFEDVVSQWKTMREAPRNYWIKKAEKWKDKLPIAEKLLELAKQPMLSDQNRVKMKRDEEFILKAKPLLTKLSYPDDKEILDPVIGKCKRWIHHSTLAKEILEIIEKHLEKPKAMTK